MKQLFTILTAVVLMILGCSCTKEHIKYDQLKGNNYYVYPTATLGERCELYYIHFNLDNTYTASVYKPQVGRIDGFYLDETNNDYIYLPRCIGGYCHPEKAILKDTTIVASDGSKFKMIKATFVDSGIDYYLEKDKARYNL